MKITNIERYILECLDENKYGINEINFHTQLDQKVVENCLHRLISIKSHYATVRITVIAA